MKLPFDFGIKLFFRLLLPGFFIAFGFMPILFAVLDHYGQSNKHEISFIIGTVITGWAVIILDTPIYMLFEGRRFWPRFLSTRFLSREERRLKIIKEKVKKLEILDRKTYLEASVELRRFPTNNDGEYEAFLPTRLGNLITAFETYPDTRYGMDGVFYWYRIWIKLDKDLREEIDNQQALADSTVYISFALIINGLLCLVYAILLWFGISLSNHLPNSLILCSLTLVCFLAAYLVYRISIVAYVQFGELFKSVFDIYRIRIKEEVSEALSEVLEFFNDASLKELSSRYKYKIVWRYLHNYKIKCPRCGRILLAPDIKKHDRELHPAIEGNVIIDAPTSDQAQIEVKA
jgi:hypothetical protein